MSIKLPLIIKRQIKPSPKKILQQQSHEHEPNQHQSQEEPNYEDDQFQQQPQEESKPPAETFKLLRNQQKAQSELEVGLINKEQSAKSSESQHESNVQQLRKILHQKMDEASKIRETVGEKKKEIKNINEIIDKDLNKTLFKANKQNGVNIRDIFSGVAKSSNKKINDLNEELKTIRLSIKKTKQQILKIAETMGDPVSLLNQQKGYEFQNRLKSMEEDIKQIEKQRTILNEQITRGGRQYNEQEEKQKTDEIAKLNTNLIEIMNFQKQMKANIYSIEKEDIILMQKIKFVQEKQGNVGQAKKYKMSEKDKAKIDEQIRQLIEQINRLIDQRNKIEGDKKNTIKTIFTEIASLESKNWDLCNKLREIDTFLLQYYQKKAKRRQVKHSQQKNNEDTIQKSISGKIKPQSLYLETPAKTISYDDKNIISDIVLVEKKKNYSFNLAEISQNEIVLSDQFLGNKLNISKITLIADEVNIYSIKIRYRVNEGEEIDGYVMGSRASGVKYPKMVIQLNRQVSQIINFIHVCYSQKNTICYYLITTTQGKEYKWGNIEKSLKSDQKHIKKYEYCCVKAKFVPIQSLDKQQTQYCLSGLILSTIYLAPK